MGIDLTSYNVKDFQFTIKEPKDTPDDLIPLGKTIEFTISGSLSPKHALESYTPKEVGIPWKEIPRIYVGGCGGVDGHHFDDEIFHKLFSYGEAHTHMCPLDPIYNSICLTSKKLILYKSGDPTDLMWHEYGHALTPWLSQIWHGENNTHRMIFDERDADISGHGPRWKETMRSLGKPHLQTKNVAINESELLDNLGMAV